MRVLIALLLCAGALFADDFADANAAYAAGKYADAKRGYERVLANGWSANAVFNYGNTHFRMDDPGRAALAYERTLLLDPKHPEALANLKYVREKVGARIGESLRRQYVERYALMPMTTWLCIGAGWVGLAMMGVALWLRRRGVGFWFGGVIVLAGAGALGGIQMEQRAVRALAVVVADKVEARMEPADRAALAEPLPAASRVRVISEQGDWVYCELPGGGRGWVKVGDVERLLPGTRA